MQSHTCGHYDMAQRVYFVECCRRAKVNASATLRSLRDSNHGSLLQWGIILQDGARISELVTYNNVCNMCYILCDIISLILWRDQEEEGRKIDLVDAQVVSHSRIHEVLSTTTACDSGKC